MPLTIDFPTGQRPIDASFGYFFAWYASNRYRTIDIPFLDKYRKISINRPDLGIHLDFDKTRINIPVMEYTVHANTTNLFGGKDVTVVEQGGLAMETPLARNLNPINPAVTLRLYNNLDIHTADNSRGALVAQGKLSPGDVGAHAISNTVCPGSSRARLRPRSIFPDFRLRTSAARIRARRTLHRHTASNGK